MPFPGLCTLPDLHRAKQPLLHCIVQSGIHNILCMFPLTQYIHFVFVNEKTLGCLPTENSHHRTDAQMFVEKTAQPASMDCAGHFGGFAFIELLFLSNKK